MPATPHRCRVDICHQPRRGRDLLCARCWALVPPNIRRDVLAHHNPRTQRQTPEYFTAVDDAIDAAKTALLTPKTAPTTGT
jgi:hypothetical protein